MAALKVVAPLVILQGNDDKHHYLYAGAVVEPSLYSDEQIKQLKADGSLGSEKDLAAEQQSPAGDAGEEPKKAAPKKAAASNSGN